MELHFGPGATDYIRTHGGRCYVFTSGPCCGGTRFVESSLTAPHDPAGFRVVEADGVTVLVRAALGRWPEQVEVRLAGRSRRRLRATFNGCAFLV